MKIKILVISNYMVCPPISGGARRMLFPPMNFKEKDTFEFTYIYMTYSKELQQKNELFLSKFPMIKESISLIVDESFMYNGNNMPGNISDEFWYTMNRDFKDLVIKKIKMSNFDIIQIEHTQMAWIVPFLRIYSPKSKIILNYHNMEWLIFKRWLEYSDDNRFYNIESKYKKLQEWENMVLDWFDSILCISPVEKKIIEKTTTAKVYYAPSGAGISDEEYIPKEINQNKKYDLIFIGSMNWFPNVHALKWFLEEVMPIISSKRPKTKLEIIGSGKPDSSLRKILRRNRNVTFWGEVQDERPFLHNGKVFISPIWIGAGVRLKNPTAWAAKIPVVATSISVEGLEYKNNRDLIIGDTPQEFASAVISLLENNSLAMEISNNAYQTYKNRYSNEIIVDIWQKLYKEIYSTECINFDSKEIFDSEDINLEGYVLNFYNLLEERYNLNGKRILEIGCGDGSLLKKICYEYNVEEVIGIDPFLNEWWDSKEMTTSKYKIINAAGENIPFENNYFDLVISIATFEHVASPEQCLAEIKRVLKVGGEFFCEFSPIWSGIVGHHWYHWDKDKIELIPPWGHLYMNYKEMYDHLIERGISDKESIEICRTIFEDPIINRIDCKRFENAFNNSHMDIIKMDKVECHSRFQWLTGDEKNELTQDIINRLSDKYTRNELLIYGYYVILKN